MSYNLSLQELSRIAKTRFGSRWKTPLSKELGVTRETVYRWASGKQPISSTAAKAIQLLDYQKPEIVYKERRHNLKNESLTIGDALLIHGDSTCFQLKERVDVILTDPVWPNATDILVGADNPFDLFAKSMANLVSFLNPNGRIIIQLRCDSDARILAHIPRAYKMLRVVWLPYAVPSRQGRILISGDVGYIFGNPPKRRTGNQILPGQVHPDFCPPVKPNKSKHDNSHPCPRHLIHVEWLVEKFTEPTDVILDPFMGSGTTAVAAIDRGRRFVGIEIERKYWVDAKNRLQSIISDL